MSSSKSGKSYVTGYRYYADMMMAVCSRRISNIVGIMVGERMAWKGSIKNGNLSINHPKLFGGDKSEGGIIADLVVRDGSYDQEPSDYLNSRFDTPQPGYHGIVTVEMQDSYFTGPNPYPKPWKFYIENYDVPWQTSLVAPTIDGDVTGCNGVHVCWDALTSCGGEEGYGCNIKTSNIDEKSWLAAAQTCYDEGLGIAPIWTGSTSVEDFILDIVNNYLVGTIFLHPVTGLWTIKLFRDDYDVDDLDVLDESNISEIKQFSRKGYSDLYSQIVLSWTQVNDYPVVDQSDDEDDDVTGEPETTRTAIVTNLACQAIQGKIIQKTVSCPHIVDYRVAQKVSEMCLRQLSYPFAAVEITGNRELASIVPGDVKLFSWSDYGISKMPLRVTKVNYGELTNGKVTLTCVEDMFGLDATMFTGLSTIGWTSTTKAPADATYRLLVELPFHVIVNQIESEADLATRDETSGIMVALIGRPNYSCTSYDLYEYDSARAAYVDRGTRLFTPTGIISNAIDQSDTDITVTGITEPRRIDPDIDYLAIIDSEWIRIPSGSISVTASTATLTIDRGVLDTVPSSHSEGARIWFIGVDDYGLCETIYLQSTSIRLKACPTTSKGTLALSSATENTKTFDARAIRPYPPANIKINGSSFPLLLEKDSSITVTWDERNRIDQTGSIITQDEGNIPAESGTTFNIYVYDAETNSLIHTETGIESGVREWTYALDDEFGERGERVGLAVNVAIESVRDGFESWQKFYVAVPERELSFGCLVDNAGNIIVTNTGAQLSYQE